MSYRLLTRGVLRLADNLQITRDMPEWEEYRAWIKAGNTPEPMAVSQPPAPTLDEAKAAKIRQIKAGALSAVRARLPDTTDVSTLILLIEAYLSIAPAARQPTTAMTAVIGIYNAMRIAIGQVRACSTIDCVDAVTPVWPV